jgi:Aspartyl protease
MAVIVVQKRFVGDINLDRLKLWVIPVAIEGEQRKVTVNLLLDTGAQRTVIVPALEKILGIAMETEPLQGIGVGGKSQYLTGAVKLEIGSISLGDLNILVGILPNLFSKYQIAGILGADILQLLSLKIDYPEKLLEISRYIVCL